MAVETLLALALLAALVIYALTGGADFGSGMWDLLAFGPRAARQRAALADAIAPIWEANHVWLILLVVLLFTAFPPAFAAIMIALHVPLMLILVGVVLRGSAFVFRKYAASRDVVYRRWSTVFGASSLFTPFLLGACLGALGSGEIRVQNNAVSTGLVAGWLQPFAIGCGLFAQGLFSFLAATYMTVETRGDAVLQQDFRLRALLSGLALAPLAAAVFLLARSGAPEIYSGLTRWWAPLLLAVTSACALVALWSLLRLRFRIARIAAAAQVACILLGWGLAQYPYLVVPDVTVAGSAGAPATLRMVSWALAAGGALLLPSFLWLFRVFKARPDRR